MLHWRDVRNFLGKLTGRRLWNMGKVVASYYLSRWLKRPIPWGLPFTVSIEPTTACNLRCPECPSGLRQFTRPTGNLKTDFYRRAIDELHPHLLYLIFYFQGEPYINPDFLDMVAYAHRHKIYTITSTNGHFLNDDNARRTISSGLDRLIISLDGATQETYAQYRREGKLETVLQGARNVVKWKRRLGSATPHLVFQCLLVKPNEHEVEEIQRLASEIGIDEVRFKTAQLYDYENGHELMPSQDHHRRYRQRADGRFEPKADLHDHCWKLWHACVITWDGIVVPCCFDKDAQHRLGNLREQSLEEIWRGPAYADFRGRLFAGRSRIDICRNCTEGCRVWLQPEEV